MTIDRIDHPWAESGSLDTTLTDAKRDVGWISGDSPDQPTIERLNLLQNEVDNKVNEMLSKGPKPWNPSATMATVLTGVHSSSDAGTFGYDSLNEIDSGDATDEFVDIALAVINGSRKAIALDQTTALNVEIFDLETMTYDGSQLIPTSSLPEDSGNENWIAQGIVCDATYAYILFQDWGGTSSYQYDTYVQSYILTTWATNASWPATGLFLYDNGTIQNPGNMIFATSELLAIFDEEVTISGGTSRAVILVGVEDGTEDSYGAGDLSSQSVDCICSNGTYIFISTGNSTGSMDISSPSSGCGGTGWPRAVSGDNGIACLGDVIVSVNSNNAYVLHTDNANIATVSHTDDTVIKNIGVIVTDGLNFWVRGNKTVGATDRDCFLFKLNISGLMQENSTTPSTADTEVFECFSISIDSGIRLSRMIYDGDGIVGILNFNGDGRLFKLPKTAIR